MPVAKMVRENVLTILGILSLVAGGISQTNIPPPNGPSSSSTELRPLPTDLPGSTEPTQPLPNTTKPYKGDASKNSSTPRIQDQTAQTFAKLESFITSETDLLASVYKDFKATLAEALKNISKIEQSKLDVRPITNELNTMNTTVAAAFDAVDKRFKASLLTAGRSLNTSIASFVKSEQGYIGKMKFAPDSRSLARELRQVENDLYQDLGKCLSIYNGSVVSDIFTVRNIFNTYFMDVETFVREVAGCSSVSCAALSKTLLTNLVSWRSLTTTTFNKMIPNLAELNACVTSEINAAKTDLKKIADTVLPPVDIKAIIINQTAMLDTNSSNLFDNFTNSVHKLVYRVVDKINSIQTFAAKNARDDPKSIIDSSFKVVTSGDDVALQLMKSVLPRLTTISRRLIVPLFNRETKIQRQIETTLAKENTPSSECDAAIHTIQAIKNTFNNSMIVCFSGAHDSIDAILTATTGLINGSLATFTNQIASAEQFDCGRSCTTTAMQAFSQQLRGKLEVGGKLLAELKKSVTDQTNRVYTAFESCMNSGVQKALDEMNEQTNADIKRCLASA